MEGAAGVPLAPGTPKNFDKNGSDEGGTEECWAAARAAPRAAEVAEAAGIGGGGMRVRVLAGVPTELLLPLEETEPNRSEAETLVRDAEPLCTVEYSEEELVDFDAELAELDAAVSLLLLVAATTAETRGAVLLLLLVLVLVLVLGLGLVLAQELESPRVLGAVWVSAW